jgi:hypothetical protein
MFALMFAFHAISDRSGGEHDGIHLLWSPPFPTGHSLDGFTLERRVAKRQDGSQCFTLSPSDLERVQRLGVIRHPDATIWATPNEQKEPQKGSWTFRCDLVRFYPAVDIAASLGVAAYAARADGKVVDGRRFAGGACHLRGAGISIVWVVVTSIKAEVRICGERRDRSDWDGAKTLATGLQMPFRAADPSLATLADERNRAETQAKPDQLDGTFDELSRYANAALVRPFSAPAYRVSINDPAAEANQWDMLPFGLVAALWVSPPWRRALGFGFLDTVDLAPGEAYDYRIRALVPRADRDEARVDFHTVPHGYRLPRHFFLGPVGLHVLPTPVVEADIDSSGPLDALRKLVRFKRLVVDLPEQTERILLDGKSSGPADIVGLRGGAVVATLSLSLDFRTVLNFGTAVDEVLIKGDCALAGIVLQPLAPGLDPKEPVEITSEIYGVVFAPGSPPPPPTAIEVDNLASALRATRRGQRDDQLGFEITWDPPSNLDPALIPLWPPDAQSAPPTDVAGYVLERSVAGGPFAGLEGSDGLHFASRNAEPVTETPAPGADLLAVFPPADRPGIAGDLRVRALDVVDNDTIALGTEVRYRVASLDVIGRRSAPRLSAAVELRKLTRPPTPVAPPTPALPAPADLPLLAEPGSIEVRLLQEGDPGLSAADSARLAADGEQVILRWGWGPEQRARDPHVTEFRVYDFDGPLVEIHATPIGAAVATGNGTWRIACSLSRPVTADEFAGRKLLLRGGFRIIGHGAGTTLDVELAPIGPGTAMPASVAFTLIRTSGVDEDSVYWDRRLDVVPRGPVPSDPEAVESYEAVLPADWIATGPTRLTQVRSFGVSAADAEDYVPDRRRAVEATPRPGNESAVVHAEVVARYRGRPELTIADLADVASLVARRAAGEAVTVVFRPADLLPAGVAPTAQMRIERCPASAVLPRIVIDASAIRLRLGDGTLQPWPLSLNDEAALRAGATARSIPDRFLAAAAQRIGQLDAYRRVADADPTREMSDPLPNSPTRWVYRLRALDAAGHASVAGQVLQAVIRVPQPVPALVPELLSLGVEAGTARVRVQDRSAGTSSLFVVTSADPRLRPARADLATIRNRPDLTPLEALVVRDDRGNRLTLTPVTPGPDGTAELTFAAPEGTRFNVWALAVSADGIPSRLIGPLTAPSGTPTVVA